MIIDSLDCKSIEYTVIAAYGILIISILISGFGVYRNENEVTGKEKLVNEIFAGITVFFTDKYLNESGRKWRFFFIPSTVLFIALIIFDIYINPCSG